MSATELPPLPENEKTYAGIPEAVFVVSDSFISNKLKITISSKEKKRKKVKINT